MDWLGIGVLLIGIAFAVLVVLLIKPINKLTDTLDNVQKTSSRLPAVMDQVSVQTAELLRTSNATLLRVNHNVKEIDPYFDIIGDLGEASHELTISALGKASAWKQQTSEAKHFAEREKYGGLLGLLSFIHFLKERRQLMATKAENEQKA